MTKPDYRVIQSELKRYKYLEITSISLKLRYEELLKEYERILDVYKKLPSFEGLLPVVKKHPEGLQIEYPFITAYWLYDHYKDHLETYKDEDGNIWVLLFKQVPKQDNKYEWFKAVYVPLEEYTKPVDKEEIENQLRMMLSKAKEAGVRELEVWNIFQEVYPPSIEKKPKRNKDTFHRLGYLHHR